MTPKATAPAAGADRPSKAAVAPTIPVIVPVIVPGIAVAVAAAETVEIRARIGWLSTRLRSIPGAWRSRETMPEAPTGNAADDMAMRRP